MFEFKATVNRVQNKVKKQLNNFKTGKAWNEDSKDEISALLKSGADARSKLNLAPTAMTNIANECALS